MSMDIMQQPSIDLSQAQSIAALPPEMMLLKMENDSIMAVARATPRDPMKIVAQLQQLVDAYPAAADDAIYSKPVGTVLEVTCGACGVKYEVTKLETDSACPACESTRHGATRKVKKFAEGLSIRAAESIRSIYGYTRLATTTEVLDDGKVKLTGVLVDYAAGNVTSDERIVTPWYKARGGAMTRTPEDRFLGVVVKAEKSKLRRDVILDNTPNIVKAMFRDACEQKLAALLSPEEIEQKVLPAFARYGVTSEHLDKIIGHPRALGWNEADRLELRKILTALKNEETTVRELLDGLDQATYSASVKQAGVTMDDLTKPATVDPKTATLASAPTPRQREPGDDDEPLPAHSDAASDTEADIVAERRDYASRLESLVECEEMRRSLPIKISEAGRQKIVEAIAKREDAIRGTRGRRSNTQQRSLVNNEPSATEAGV